MNVIPLAKIEVQSPQDEERNEEDHDGDEEVKLYILVSADYCNDEQELMCSV